MRKSIYTEQQAKLRARLRAERKKLGLTQAELAKKIGIYRTFVSKYERGERRLDVFEFFAVTEALGVDGMEMLREVRG
jgi:transcriptional regulator with XRE-family HTH domain